MATSINDTHAKMTLINMVRNDLERQIKERLLCDITDAQVKLFRETIEPIIKAKVEQFSIEGINRVQSIMDIRDELNIYCKWVDDRKPK